MIYSIEGILSEKNTDRAVIDVHGVGYEVQITPAVCERLGPCGRAVKLFVVESSSMYGGTTSLYGFLSKEEKETFLCFKDNIPNTGAKKALDYVDKAGKSFSDFKRAVETQNAGLLVTIFGFTKKTAEKLIASLKGKITELSYAGKAKWSTGEISGLYPQAKASLEALGYTNAEAEALIGSFSSEELKNIKIEEFLKRALRKVTV